MISKCARKLVPRWLVLAFVVHSSIIMVVTWATGHLPENILTSTGEALDVTFGISRMFDPIIVLIPFTAIVWMSIENKKLVEHFKYIRMDESTQKAWNQMFGWGLSIGIIGGGIVAAAGFALLIGGTVVASIVILIATWEKTESKNVSYPLKESYLTECIALLGMWCTLTVLVGASAAFIYSMVGLIVSAVVHFGVPFVLKHLITFFASSSGAFRRNMLQCDVDSESC